MPGLNQTGPKGQGPMTGRRMGCCGNAGANLTAQTAETSENTHDKLPEIVQEKGLGFGQGRGSGRGRWGRFWGMGRQNRFRGGQQ